MFNRQSFPFLNPCQTIQFSLPSHLIPPPLARLAQLARPKAQHVRISNSPPSRNKSSPNNSTLAFITLQTLKKILLHRCSACPVILYISTQSLCLLMSGITLVRTHAQRKGGSKDTKTGRP